MNLGFLIYLLTKSYLLLFVKYQNNLKMSYDDDKCTIKLKFP